MDRNLQSVDTKRKYFVSNRESSKCDINKPVARIKLFKKMYINIYINFNRIR